MDHYEMVEKLRQKANVSYEEAKAALEKAEWDILDALVLLENEGKVKQEGTTYTTEEKAVPEQKKQNDFITALNRIFFHLKRFVNFLCRNEMHITWKNGEHTEMTLIILALLLCLCAPLVIIGMVIGFFCGARFTLQGPDMKKVQVQVQEGAQENQDSTQN